MKVCAEPGCAELTLDNYTRCPQHAREDRRDRDKQRPTFRDRGYDREYHRNRARILRDEDFCAICGKLVDKTLRGPDPWSPSIDHIISPEDGGTNDRSNLRLAHLRCNSARGRVRLAEAQGVPPEGMSSSE